MYIRNCATWKIKISLNPLFHWRILNQNLPFLTKKNFDLNSVRRNWFVNSQDEDMKDDIHF
jgi:hypothetical protein